MEHENKVQKLTEREHVRTAPWMWIGDVTRSENKKWILKDGKIERNLISYCPAILRMVDEIVSNSIDESFKVNHRSPDGGKMTVWIHVDDEKIQVSDNGRGIPLTVPADRKITNPDGSHTVVSSEGMTAAEIALTVMKAGSNFEDKKYASIGAHGVGATVVNILSDRFEAEVVHRNQRLHLKAEHGHTMSVKIEEVEKLRSGTSVTFYPDWSCFSGIDSLDQIHKDLIERRIVDLAAALPMITFKFNGRVVQSRDFKSYVSLLSQDKTFETFIGENVRLAVCTSQEPEQISFVNGIETYEGGSHVDQFRNRIADEVCSILKRKNKYDLKPQDIKNRLNFILITNAITNPKFRGQTKEFLSNKASDFFDVVFAGFDFEKFAKEVAKNEDLMFPILDYFRLKQKVKDADDERRKKKLLVKMNVAEHLPASSSDREKTILFITEGQSAIGQLQDVRDTKYHGGFPLRGKPINIRGMTVNELLDNVEFKKLMNIIGLVPGQDYESVDYGTIAFMADADHDGNSIMGLLINMFCLWPKLFEEKRIKLCLSPVLKWEKGKQKGIYYTMGEYDQDRKAGNIPDGAVITYLKGLGSLTKAEYTEMILNPRLVTVELDEEWKSTLHLVFGADADLRKTWLSKENRYE